MRNLKLVQTNLMRLEKPYYSSMLIIVLIPLLVLFAQIAYKEYYGEENYNLYMVVKIFHFFGGVGVSISSAGVLLQLLRRGIIVLHDEIVFRVLVFGILCFVIISWEIFEYIVLYPEKYMTYADIIMDMICGLIGGLIAFLCSMKIKPSLQYLKCEDYKMAKNNEDDL